MARQKKKNTKAVDPKKAPKKVYKGAAKGKAGTQPKPPGKSLPLLKKVVLRRTSQQVRCLREIRKAVKAIKLTIPRLPFQRLCRSICDERGLSVRWQRSALDCMQEAAEDFLIEFFQDSYICAAHAKRITLMDKDFVTLRRLRYRFSKLLDPLPISDKRTFDILNIPPYRKPKPGETDIVIEDVTHKIDTRLKTQATSLKQEKDEAAAKERRLEKQRKLRDKVILIEDELPSILEPINPDGFVVRLFMPDDPLKRDDYITLDKECITILKNKIREINGPLIITLMRYLSGL